MKQHCLLFVVARCRIASDKRYKCVCARLLLCLTCKARLKTVQPSEHEQCSTCSRYTFTTLSHTQAYRQTLSRKYYCVYNTSIILVSALRMSDRKRRKERMRKGEVERTNWMKKTAMVTGNNKQFQSFLTHSFTLSLSFQRFSPAAQCLSIRIAMGYGRALIQNKTYGIEFNVRIIKRIECICMHVHVPSYLFLSHIQYVLVCAIASNAFFRINRVFNSLSVYVSQKRHKVKYNVQKAT